VRKKSLPAGADADLPLGPESVTFHARQGGWSVNQHPAAYNTRQVRRKPEAGDTCREEEGDSLRYRSVGGLGMSLGPLSR
jgi:hypothetical protein